MKPQPDYAEAIRLIATAVGWLAQGTVHMIGTRDAQAVLDKLAEALDAAGVEIGGNDEPH